MEKHLKMCTPTLILSLFMKRIVSTFCLIISMFSISYGLQGVNFENISLDKAIEKAQQAEKKVLIDFYTERCIGCEELDRHIFQDSSISLSINTEFICIRKNAEEEEGASLFKKYDLMRSYPTVLILDSKGREIDRIVGMYDKEEYFRRIRDAAENKNTLSDLLSKLGKEKDNYHIMLKIADKYYDRGIWQKAIYYYETSVTQEQYASNDVLWFKLGLLYSRIGETKSAIKALNTAIGINSDNEYYHRLLNKLKAREND